MSSFILGVNGSPHREGTGSRLLAESLLGAHAAGAEEVELVHLADVITKFPPADYGKEMPPPLKSLSELLLRADGIIFSTPVNWFNMSTLMKALFDLMTPLEFPDFPLEGKVAGLIATCDEDGGQQALSLMAAPLVHYGFIIPPYGMVFHNNKVAAASEGNWQSRDCRLLGQNVARMVKKTKSAAWGY